MTKILSDKKKGSAEIKHFTIEKYNYRLKLPVGEYVRLLINGQCAMSNTPMEKFTNQSILRNAHGKVLIGGLGIGLTLLPIADKTNVSDILVVEQNQDVIDIVYPQIEPYLHNKVEVVRDSVFEYVPTEKFNTIYLDIWDFVNSDIYDSEMEPLMDYYSHYLEDYDKNAYIDCWCSYNAENDIPLTYGMH